MFRRYGALVCLVAMTLLIPAPAGAAGLPDLVVKSMAAPTSVLAGKTITVSTTVANIRRPRTVSSYVRVVLSRDRVLQGTDRVLGNRWVPGLPVNGTSTGKQTYTIPSTTTGGTWYLVACADITKRVREYREGNNCRSLALTVTRPNRLPVAQPDSFATTEDGGAMALTAASLLANDTDPDAGTTLQVTAVGSASHGALTPLVSGAFTFTPDADFNGTAGFSYTLSDGKASVQGAVTVQVTAVNDAPVATADGFSTSEDLEHQFTAASLLANDTDADGDVLTVSAVSTPAHGIVTGAAGNFTYTPAANFNGTDGFSYTVTDGVEFVQGTVNVTVYAVNDGPPVAGTDAFSTYEDLGHQFTAASLLANDTDADGDVLTVSAVSTPAHGIVTGSAGNFTYTPAANFNGTDGFSYTVTDGVEFVQGTVNVTVYAVNDAPVALDDQLTIDRDTVAYIQAESLLANEIDVDGPSLSVTSVFNAAHGTVSINGSLITFTPEAGFSGDAGFAYMVSDGSATDIGLVTVHVLVPQAIETSVSSVNLGEAGSGTFGIRLAVQPAGDVTVSVSSLDTTAVTVSPSSLVFTPSNWATLQNVTVAGVEDVDLTNEIVAISVTSTGLTSKSVTANVTDNDSQAVHASATQRSVREGSSTLVGITLAYQPASNTTVTCTASPAGSVGVTPSTLTFTPSNYATPQNITLFGSIDGDQVDDEAVVTCSAPGASSATIAVTVVEIV